MLDMNPLPKLILLPGMDGTGTLFAPLIEHLLVDCVSISYPPDRVLDYEELTALVHSQLPRHEPFILLGESFSGPIAIALAASNPPGLIGLILCASFAQTPYLSLRPLARFAHLLPINLPAYFFSTMLMGPYATPELQEMIDAALQTVSSHVLRNRIKSILMVDYLWKLQEIHVLTVYLRATHDRAVPPSAAGAFILNNAYASVVEIDAPHFVLQCCPKASAIVLHRFVSSLNQNQ